MSPGAHNLRFIDAADRTGLYTVLYVGEKVKNKNYDVSSH